MDALKVSWFVVLQCLIVQADYKGSKLGQLGTLEVLAVDCARILVADGAENNVIYMAEFLDRHEPVKLEYVVPGSGNDVLLYMPERESTWSLSSLYTVSTTTNETLFQMDGSPDAIIPTSLVLGELQGKRHKVKGRVIAYSERHIKVDGFSYDGEGDDIYFIAGDTENPDNDGTRLLEIKSGNFSENEEYCMQLPTFLKMAELKYVSVFSISTGEDFGSLTVQSVSLSPDEDGHLLPPSIYEEECKIDCLDRQEAHGVEKFEYKGFKAGEMKGDNFSISGTVYVADCTHLVISDFNLHDPPRFTGFWSNLRVRSCEEDGTGSRAVYKSDYYHGLTTYNGKDIIIELPEEHYSNAIRLFYLWNYQTKESYGGITFPDIENVTIPSPEWAGEFEKTSHDVGGCVLLLNERQLFVKNFAYDGLGENAYFYVGKGKKPRANSEKQRAQEEFLANTPGPLQATDRECACITLPEGMTIFDIGHLSVWSETEGKSYGHVSIPKDVLIPPYLNGYKHCVVDNCMCTQQYFYYQVYDDYFYNYGDIMSPYLMRSGDTSYAVIILPSPFLIFALLGALKVVFR